MPRLLNYSSLVWLQIAMAGFVDELNALVLVGVWVDHNESEWNFIVYEFLQLFEIIILNSIFNILCSLFDLTPIKKANGS